MFNLNTSRYLQIQCFVSSNWGCSPSCPTSLLDSMLEIKMDLKQIIGKVYAIFNEYNMTNLEELRQIWEETYNNQKQKQLGCRF